MYLQALVKEKSSRNERERKNERARESGGEVGRDFKSNRAVVSELCSVSHRSGVFYVLLLA